MAKADPAQRERQWTLYGQGPDHQVVADGPRLGWNEVLPVCACDDAAIERGHLGLIAAPYDWRTYRPAIVAQIVLMAAAGATDDEISEFVLRAAGETP